MIMITTRTMTVMLVHVILSKVSCFFYWNPFIFVGYRNDRFFSHTNPYISKVTQQCRCSPMLIFRAWASCGLNKSEWMCCPPWQSKVTVVEERWRLDYIGNHKTRKKRPRVQRCFYNYTQMKFIILRKKWNARVREDTWRKYYPFLQKISRESCHDAGTPSLSSGRSWRSGVTKTKLTNK